MDPTHMKGLKNAAMAECTLFPHMPAERGRSRNYEPAQQRVSDKQEPKKKSASVENRRRLCFVYFVGRDFPGRLQLVSECDLQNTALSRFHRTVFQN